MNAHPLLSRIETSKSLPTLPHLLLKLIDTCNRREKGIKDLSRIINRDPSLSERVLRLVNSAYYSLKQKVSSIDQALLLLGTDAVKNIAISSSVYQVFHRTRKATAFNLKLFWWHSFSCAVLSRLIALKLQFPSPDEAFLSGLLHDIGRIVLWVNFEEEYEAVLKGSGGRSAEMLAGEKKLGLTHSEVGFWLISRWDLRSFMPDAVRYHHEPVERIASSSPLVQIVYAANQLCPIDPDQGPQHAAAGRILGLQPHDLGKIVELAETEAKDIARSLDIEIEPPPEGARGFTAGDQRKLEELVELVRDFSLLQSVSEGFLQAAGREAVLQAVRQGLSLLFDLPKIFHFHLEGRVLAGEPIGSQGENGLLGGLSIPFHEEASLLARCLLESRIMDSFEAEEAGPLSIIDEQLIRLLEGEGMLCLPLKAEEENLGVIVVGIGSGERAHLVRKRTLLSLFAHQAALVLYAHRLKERQAERIREERISASSMLARRIVHEAHNPLGIINNYLSILSAKLMDNASIQDDLRIVREEIRRVSQIISELSSFSTPGAAVMEPVDLNALVTDIMKISQESFWEISQVRVNLSLDPKVPAFRSEKNKLKQLFINLIKNGAEAMPGGGSLYLETRFAEGEPGTIEALVRDEGPGIPEEIRARLFEPFVSTKGHEGLGLSIAYGIVKELGGQIAYETSSGGTIFRVRIPLQ